MAVAVAMAVGLAVAMAVGLAVAVAVGLAVAVAVGLAVAVAVGLATATTGVGPGPGVGLAVAVAVAFGLTDAWAVAVAVAVGLALAVAVGLATATADAAAAGGPVLIELSRLHLPDSSSWSSSKSLISSSPGMPPAGVAPGGCVCIGWAFNATASTQTRRCAFSPAKCGDNRPSALAAFLNSHKW